MKNPVTPKFLCVFLILLSAVVMAWVVVGFLIDVGIFIRLDSSAPATISVFKIQENKDQSCYIEAVYNYKIKDQNITKNFVFKKNHLNYTAAFSELKGFSKRNWIVWYDSKNFMFSSLEKTISCKKIVYSFLSILLFFYFIVLKKHMKNFNFL
jgi:hypothetical protein